MIGGPTVSVDRRLLDNVAWHALSGPHAKFSTGTAHARRYSAGFSPIVGFENPTAPDFAALTPFCALDEHFYCEGWRGRPPEGWVVEVESTMFKMVWTERMPAPDDAPDIVRLGPEHAPQALELATSTRSGPFGPRTIELGDYFGCFDGPRLVAMAGERMCAGTLREISGVATHPDFRGHGLARRLIAHLVRREMQRGETPFLHVMRDNTRAYGVYEEMGFVEYREAVVRVVSRTA